MESAGSRLSEVKMKILSLFDGMACGMLAYIPSEAPLPTVHESYIADHEAWVCILTAERYSNGEVTHWMPMPEPPKEGCT